MLPPARRACHGSTGVDTLPEVGNGRGCGEVALPPVKQDPKRPASPGLSLWTNARPPLARTPDSTERRCRTVSRRHRRSVLEVSCPP